MNLKNPEIYPGDLPATPVEPGVCGCGDERCDVCFPGPAAPLPSLREGKGGEGSRARSIHGSLNDPEHIRWLKETKLDSSELYE